MDRVSALSRLIAQPTLVNKEVHLALRRHGMFALLGGDADLLNRLAAPGWRPDSSNLGAYYHLNMLQNIGPRESEESEEIEAEVRQLRSAEEPAIADIVVDGSVLVSAGTRRALGFLIDLWVIPSTGGVRRFPALGPDETGALEIDEVPLRRELDAGGGSASAHVMVAGNLARAGFLYGSDGYFRMVLEAGATIQLLGANHALHSLTSPGLSALNAIFRFNGERYSALAILRAARDGP
jgi:hypothetical protein